MKKTILLLEDDSKTLEVTEEILLGEGYRVIALNHYEPVSHIIEFGPELILLDVRLTNGYGHILCAQLKGNSHTAGIPVILVSAADNLGSIAEECHADNYLSKPYNMNTLVEMIKIYE